VLTTLAIILEKVFNFQAAVGTFVFGVMVLLVLHNHEAVRRLEGRRPMASLIAFVVIPALVGFCLWLWIKPPSRSSQRRPIEVIREFLHDRTIVYVQPMPLDESGGRFTLDHIGNDHPALNVEVLAWDQDKGIGSTKQVISGKNINPGGGLQTSHELFRWRLGVGITKLSFKISDTKWRSIQELWIMKASQSAEPQFASRLTDEASGEVLVACTNPKIPGVPWNALKVAECMNWPLFREGNVVPDRTANLW